MPEQRAATKLVSEKTYRKTQQPEGTEKKVHRHYKTHKRDMIVKHDQYLPCSKWVFIVRLPCVCNFCIYIGIGISYSRMSFILCFHLVFCVCVCGDRDVHFVFVNMFVK